MANPTTSIELVDFAIFNEDGYEHYYAIDAAGVTATITLSLNVHHRFQIRCLSDSLIALTGGVSVVLPDDKILAPFGDNAVIGFTVVSANTLDVFGDLADA